MTDWIQNILNGRLFKLVCKLREMHTRSIFYWLVHWKSKKYQVTNRACIIVAPHQDDETLGCGGLIAMKRERNVSVTVVFVTDGGATPGAEAPFSSERLVRRRIAEAVSAMESLGVESSSIHFLGQPDGALTELSKDRREALIERLAGIIRASGATELFVPHQYDRHPDHEATFRVAQKAVELSGAKVKFLQYVVWMTWLSPLWLRLKPSYLRNAHALSIRSAMGKKCGAIGAYSSQIPLLPPGFLDRFLGPYEVFFSTPAEVFVPVMQEVAA